MKHIYKTSTALFMALAVFAMIFTGCKKSDSNNGGGTPIPTPGNYGTITLGDQTYNIVIGGYEAYYNEELQTNVVTIALADGTSESANMYGLSIPNYDNIPTGTFDYTISGNEAEGMCMGIFTQGGTQNVLLCLSGSVTIRQSGSKYKIVSSGIASDNPFGTQGSGLQFTVDFEGPLVNE